MCPLVAGRCGYATLHDVFDKSQEDRMESFFLSETCKYLYLVSVMGVARGCGFTHFVSALPSCLTQTMS